MTSASNRTASQHNETGATHGLNLIFWLLEQGPGVAASIPALAGLLGAGLAPRHKLLAGLATQLTGSTTVSCSHLASPGASPGASPVSIELGGEYRRLDYMEVLLT